MKPVYIDIHIHTSEDANKINTKYDCDMLLKKVREVAGDAEIVLSLTDHNTINKNAYLELKQKVDHLIMGVELHIRKDEECPPYHCHLLLNLPIEERYIDEINDILDKIYPDKCVNDKMSNIPTIETVSNEFDKYDYLLLPHGGQSHRTFDKSIKQGKQFDTTLEKSIYYNQFDGFTARSSSGLEETIKYFKRLGINEFINLLTCSDNYNPARYPEAKNKDAEKFTPTWMFASPTFEGLRLSLSESTRLVYSDKIPQLWSQCIEDVKLQNEKIDMNVTLTSGLNVVIGGSSSGKTLFVDSVYRKLDNKYEQNPYEEFQTEKIYINNPSGMVPHYINQNFIISILHNKDKDINDIPIIAKVFPVGADIDASIRNKLADFKEHINYLVDAVKNIDDIQTDLKKIPTPNMLIVSEKVKRNILSEFEPDEQEMQKCRFQEADKIKYMKMLDELSSLFDGNAFAKNVSKEITTIKDEINRLADISKLTDQVTNVVINHKEKVDNILALTNQEGQSKNNNREKLISLIDKYLHEIDVFNKELTYISNYNVEFKTREISIRGHKLSIENSFKLTPEIIIDSINTLLKLNKKINDFNSITPEMLFRCNFRGQNPRVKDYDDFIDRLYNKTPVYNIINGRLAEKSAVLKPLS